MISILAGLGLGLSLIVAIGAQNVFVLRQGIRRDHVLAVVIVCTLSDAVLILAGVGGLGALIAAAPWIVVAARWLGAAFLLGYGLMAVRRAWRGTETLHVEDADRGTDLVDGDRPLNDAPTTLTSAPRTRTRLAPVLLTVLALTWLNPHVYLDTVLLIGSVASTHGDDRWWFAVGAVLASALWFIALGFGARLLGRWLDTSRAWRILDAIIAIVMIGLAVGLIAPVLVG